MVTGNFSTKINHKNNSKGLYSMKIFIWSVLFTIGFAPSLFCQDLTKEIIGVWSADKIVNSDKTVDERVGKEYKLLYEFKNNGKLICTGIEGSKSDKIEIDYAITEGGKISMISPNKEIIVGTCSIKDNKMVVTHDEGESMTLIKIVKDKKE